MITGQNTNTSTENKLFSTTFNQTFVLGLNEIYWIDRSILNCGYVFYTPPTLSDVNNPNQQNIIDIAKEDGVMSLKDSYLKSEFDTKQTIGDDSANEIEICIVKLNPTALISEFKLSTSSGKRLEFINYVLIFSLM